MSKENIIKRMELLAGVLNSANYNYYVKNNPTMTDGEYDAYMSELENLESLYPKFVNKDSPTKKVGDVDFKASKFDSVKHIYPMLSLMNTYNKEEVKKFLATTNYPVVVELKYDGASLELRYKDGKLKKALSRGNGKVGEDITDNVIKITNIPKTITYKGDLEIRGEVVMYKNEFERLNIERGAAGKELFSNCRNAASGMLRQKDNANVSGLSFIAYNVPTERAKEISGLTGHYATINFIQSLGFVSGIELKMCYNEQEVLDHIEYWGNNKQTLPFDMDGMVIKTNDFAKQDELGSATKYPKWAVAYKYPSEQATTILKDVTYQVGKLGTITPVAELEPVEINGSTIARATLHNFDEIKRLGLKIGDSVFIERAAEIIPKVVKAIPELRTGKEIDIITPTVCPDCGTPLVQVEGEVAIKCPNFNCGARMKGLIKSFVGKKGLDIQGLGDEIVEALYNAKLIEEPKDVFNLDLHIEEMKLLPKMGDKKIANIIKAINACRNIAPEQAIYALQIETVGQTVSGILLNHYKHFDKVITATKEELANIQGIGDVCAESIVNTVTTEYFTNLYNRMKLFGIKFWINTQIQVTPKTELTDKKFCVTGTLWKTRAEIHAEIKEKGGIIKDSIVKDLDYLVVGTDAGSKLDKAIQLGITTLDETEFRKLMKGA